MGEEKWDYIKAWDLKWIDKPTKEDKILNFIEDQAKKLEKKGKKFEKKLEAKLDKFVDNWDKNKETFKKKEKKLEKKIKSKFDHLREKVKDAKVKFQSHKEENIQ